MKATSRLIDQAGTSLLPIFLRREDITAYQCPEEDHYDFVVSIEGRFIRIELKSVNGDSDYPTAGKVTPNQFSKADYLIVYLLDSEKNRFFTIPMKRVPRNSPIRFIRGKNGVLTSKWSKYEGFESLKKEIGLFYLKKDKTKTKK